MKKVLVLLCVLAVTGIASADLLTNGDFQLDDGVDPLNAADWNEWNSGGWVNREDPQVPGEFHYAIGNAGPINNGVWQDVLVADDGATYKLSADVYQDAWWKPDGYVKIEFFDDAAATTQLGFAETWIYAAGYDIETPWANHSITAVAPAGTTMVRAVLGSWTFADGGTTRFDNAVLTVVPEPATMALLGLGGLFLRRRRA